MPPLLNVGAVVTELTEDGGVSTAEEVEGDDDDAALTAAHPPTFLNPVETTGVVSTFAGAKPPPTLPTPPNFAHAPAFPADTSDVNTGLAATGLTTTGALIPAAFICFAMSFASLLASFALRFSDSPVALFFSRSAVLRATARAR
jgi:hypothetical protein